MPTALHALETFLSPLRTHPWAYPALEALHILGIALLLGNLVLLEFRVWGRASGLPVRELARLALSIAIAGFGLAAATGLLMFASQISELLANRAFTLKLLLLFVAGCNAVWFHARDSLARLDALAKAQTMFSTLLWLAVIACGRAIAYL
jgi:hypothetical protein